jgi:hypothetical protein
MINGSINGIKFPLTLTLSPIRGEGKIKKIALSFTLS